jgi:hypothetical protein
MIAAINGNRLFTAVSCGRATVPTSASSKRIAKVTITAWKNRPRISKAFASNNAQPDINETSEFHIN